MELANSKNITADVVARLLSYDEQVVVMPELVEEIENLGWGIGWLPENGDYVPIRVVSNLNHFLFEVRLKDAACNHALRVTTLVRARFTGRAWMVAGARH